MPANHGVGLLRKRDRWIEFRHKVSQLFHGPETSHRVAQGRARRETFEVPRRMFSEQTHTHLVTKVINKHFGVTDHDRADLSQVGRRRRFSTCEDIGQVAE